VVFDYLADARHEPEWLPGASDVALVSSEPISEGSRFVGQHARAGQVEVTVTRFERPNRLTLHGEAKNLSFDDEIELTSPDGDTELRAVMRTRPKGVFRLIAPLMGRVIARQFQGNWEALRARLEGDAPR
jgi:hypothetical protein